MNTFRQMSYPQKQKLYRDIRWIIGIVLIFICVVNIVANVYTSFRYGYMAGYEVSDKDFRTYKKDFDCVSQYLLAILEDGGNSEFTYMTVGYSSAADILFLSYTFEDKNSNYTHEVQMSEEMKKHFENVYNAFSLNSNYGYLDNIIVKPDSVTFKRQSYELTYSTDWFKPKDTGRYTERRTLHWFHSIYKN